MLRRLVWVVLMLTGVGFAGAALSNAAERWLIYPMDATRVSPADAGLPQVREQIFESDGERLVVWTAPPQPGQPVILYFHGNAGNLAARAGRFRRFLRRGYGLIAPAYRGSSGSSGTPSQDALRQDADRLYGALDAMMAGIAAHQVVIYGESLGSTVALHLLAGDAADPSHGAGPPGAVILEAPFTSVAALVGVHYPQLAPMADQLSNQWDSLGQISAVVTPLMILHGTQDALIPIEMGRQLYAAAPSEHKQFVQVQGGGHNDLWRSNVLPQIWSFIDAYLLR